MISGWDLPVQAQLAGRLWEIHTDYRDILEILSYLDDPRLPEFLRWQIALALFYEKPLPAQAQEEGMAFLARFLNGGRDEPQRPGPRLLDWEQDAQVIVAEVNRVAGQEVRAAGYIHWWTFLAYFHGIGEGQLSTLVCLRDKLCRGIRLEKWEQEYYRQNKSRVDLKKHYSAAELAQQERLRRLLGEKGG